MPTTYSEQFFGIDPANPPAVGSALNVVVATMLDQNDDGIIGAAVGDTYNGSAITSVWIGDVITVNIPGTSNVTIAGVTRYVAGRPEVCTPTGDTVLENATSANSTFVTTSTELPVGTLGPPCFPRGTLIATEDGTHLIKDLAP